MTSMNEDFAGTESLEDVPWGMTSEEWAEELEAREDLAWALGIK
jgi:hypothetical protein